MAGQQTGYSIDYRTPAGEPSLVPPGSPQWRVFKNPIALAVGGVAAVLLEFADARIRSGVWDHSTFKTDPIGRSQRTADAAMIGVYGPASAARRMIAGVNRMHARVAGETPQGEAYRALDTELLDWVSATASWGFLTAYDRFVARVSDEDRTQYYRDGETVARLYGAVNPLRSDSDFFAMLNRLSPRFEPHPINREFLKIVMSVRAAPMAPLFLQRAAARASVSLLPPSVRTTLELGSEFDLSQGEWLLLQVTGRLADRYRDRTSPAWQGASRMGLPGNFAWRSRDDQARLLAAHPTAPVSAAAS